MEDVIITPQDVTNICKRNPDEISAFSEQVMQANAMLGNITDELYDLSQNVADLYQTKEEYDKVAKHVKQQMRNLVGKL